MPELLYEDRTRLNRRFFVLIVFFIVVLLLNFAVYNILVGLLFHFYAPTLPVFWHPLSAILLLFFIVLMIMSALLKAGQYRMSGQHIAQYYGARKVEVFDCVPEEALLLQLNTQMAQRCAVAPAQVYVFDKELGINALTVGYQQNDLALIVTWGALQSLKQEELNGILAHQYCHIMQRSYVFKTILEVGLSGVLLVSVLGGRLIISGMQYSRSPLRRLISLWLIVVGALIWLAGSLGIWLSRLLKWRLFSTQEWQIDETAHKIAMQNGLLNALRRIEMHPYGSHLYRAQIETLSHYCFANPLSERNWLQLWQPLAQRIDDLQPRVDAYPQRPRYTVQHQLKKLLTLLFLPTKEHLILENLVEQQQATLTLPRLRQFTPEPADSDQIRALPLEVRHKISHSELIARALMTASGCREIITAILLIRQAPYYIESEPTISRAIMHSLSKLDSRAYVQIFYQALQRLQKLPPIIALPYIQRLTESIQADGQINLLDVLLLEKVKASQGMLIQVQDHDNPPLVALIHVVDAILALPSTHHDYDAQKSRLRRQILQHWLPDTDHPLSAQIPNHIPDQTPDNINLPHDLAILSNLLMRERLYILHRIEQILWLDYPISQDQSDSMQLLYWRFGFDGSDAVERLLQHGDTLII